ncbi:hypothetical protein A2U01_0012018, partial [Trifolium medium]|nr:hypothetical protein [Trifolium medium]
GFDNAVAQLEVLNPGLQTTGSGFWRKVEDGKVVLPPENEIKEANDLIVEDGDDDMEQDNPEAGEQKNDEEEGQDESG